MKTRLFLARHGETQWNTSQRLQGRLDSPLTELGKQQAIQLANKLAEYNITHIFSSPLLRALETAKIVQAEQAKWQPQLNIFQLVDLQERDFGDWQGLYNSELQHLSHYHETTHQITALNLHNGESALACGLRIKKALTHLIEQLTQSQSALTVDMADEHSATNHTARLAETTSTQITLNTKATTELNIVVIFHGEALRCFLGLISELPSKNAYLLYQNGCVLSLDYQHNHNRFKLNGAL